ncbi:YciI family protein [Weeksellaceae bacterium A-14]
MAYFIATYTHPDEEGWKKHLQAHIDFLIDCVEKGKIFSSGPFIDTPVRSAAIIFQVEDRKEVEALVAKDPYTIYGQVGECVIREWKPLFGTLADGKNEVPKVFLKS